MSELHVVIGAGQVGTPLAERLSSEGRRVRLVRHSSRGALAGVEVAQADLADREAVMAATAGASVIYHCSNPAYFAALWGRELPKWAESLIAAAARAQARLVVLDNVYAFGRLDGRALDEAVPMNPASRKGEVRARVAERYGAAHANGEARVAIARASDFYGPRGTLTYFGDQFWPSVLKGKPAIALGNWETPHTYHYIPDVVRGLAALGSAADDVTGGWWMLPCAPAVASRALGEQLAAAAGRTLRTRALPLALFPLVGLFVKEMPELREMLYQWEAPFVMNDAKFRKRFPEIEPEARDEAVKATAAWAVGHYRKR